MNKRIRKKQLKKIGAYVNPKDTYSLDVTIAKFVLIRLKLYKKLTNGYPFKTTYEEWIESIDKMIKAFELIIDDRYFGLDRDDKEVAVIEEGLDLFRKHYFDLWW